MQRVLLTEKIARLGPVFEKAAIDYYPGDKSKVMALIEYAGKSLPGFNPVKFWYENVTDRMDQIDRHVGNRMNLKRQQLGLSRQEVARYLKLGWQQIQKYEEGINDVPSSVLFRLSHLYGTNAGYFFEKMPLHLLTPQADTSTIPDYSTDIPRFHQTLFNAAVRTKRHEKEAYEDFVELAEAGLKLHFT
jgi:transcriptional regulator with XRE-family HTH domain